MTAALAPSDRDERATPVLGTAAGESLPTPRHRPYLVPVPDCEPPFDDEAVGCPHHGGGGGCPGDDPDRRFTVRHGLWRAATPAATSWSGVGHLTAARPEHRVSPAVPARSAGPAGPAVPVGSAGPAGLMGPVGPVGSAGPTAVHGGPVLRSEHRPRQPVPGSADHSARMLARALVEVLAGHRPAQQLRGFCSPTVFATLQCGERRRTPALPHVLTVRVCEPTPGAAEVATVYRRGDRVRMVAFRLERPDVGDPGGEGRWTITALQAG